MDAMGVVFMVDETVDGIDFVVVEIVVVFTGPPDVSDCCLVVVIRVLNISESCVVVFCEVCSVVDKYLIVFSVETVEFITDETGSGIQNIIY